MEIFSAILVIVLVAAVAFVILRSRPGGSRGVNRPHPAPLGRRDRGARRSDPMAAAVADHAQATDPADVVAAEQRLRTEARNIAAGLRANGAVHTDPAYAPPAAGQAYVDPAHGATGAPPTSGGYYAPASTAASTDPNLDREFDPRTGERIDGHEDPASDPRLHDSRYDGRLAADWVDPREDDRIR